MTDTRRQSELYRDGAKLAQEIESLVGLHKDIALDKRPKRIAGQVVHYRTHGIPVSFPRAAALRALSDEIASKQAKLDTIKKALK